MKPLAKWAWNIGRLAVGIGLAGWIFHRIWSQPHDMDIREWAPNWFWLMLAGHFMLLGAYLLGITRWRLLLKSHHIGLPWSRCFSLFFIGHFFNAFLLGATGGDVMKAYYAARETHHQKTEAVTTVFLDRLLGLVALVILVLVILTCRIHFLITHPSLEKAALFLLVLLVVLGAGSILLLRRNWLESRFWKRVTTSSRIPGAVSSHVGRIYSAVYHFREKPGLLAKALSLSLGVHILSLGACFLFATAIRSGLTFFQAFTLFPLLGALGAIPITPGGLGIREGGAVMIFGTVGIPPLTAFILSLFPWLSVTLWSLFGGILYLLEPLRRKRQMDDA